MAIPQPITKQDELRLVQKEQEKERQAFVEEEANMLREAQRRARIIQEEVEISETEERESSGGTGNLAVPHEEVKLSSYAGPLMVACFKDLLDFTVFLAFPGIGTVFGVCCTVLIFLLLFFPKRRYKLAGNIRLAIIDAFILLGLIPIEGVLFPFNLLPFTIAAVGMIYTVDRKFVAKRNSKKFDRKAMKSKLSGIIGQAWRNREAPMKNKGDLRNQMRELNT